MMGTDAKSLALNGLSADTTLQAVQFTQFTLDNATKLLSAALTASWHPDGRAATAQVLPANLCIKLLKQARAICKQEPAVVDAKPAGRQLRVTVFGDIHGHLQDLANMLQTLGFPSTNNIYIFNGDYVDRGAWGIEVLMVLVALKCALPHNVYLLRGNHETSWCTRTYGFHTELQAKYGSEHKELYKDVLSLFAQLPLAAVVEGNTLILHGGLFRVPPTKTKDGEKAPAGLKLMSEEEQQTMATGSLADLRTVKKGSVDPDPWERLKQLIASDVVWSDPSSLKGHHPNVQRGVGTRFGPDVTEAFLSSNKLKLIIRSHEGPDARHKRPPEDRMPSIDDGYCIDHDTPSGKLVTLFSAPDYPMFGEDRFHNRAAVLHLTAPDYATPEVQTFDAVLPRPQVGPYYVPDSMHSDPEQSGELSDHDVSSGSACMSEEAHCSSPTSSLAGAGQHHTPQQQQQQATAQDSKGITGADGAAAAQDGRYPKRQRQKAR